MTEEINVCNIQVGDTVHFRCGGSAIVTKREKRLVTVEINCDIETHSYLENGLLKNFEYSLLDIVKITPKPFDWKDAKWGMAFQYANASGMVNTYHFVGRRIDDKDHGVFDYHSIAGYSDNPHIVALRLKDLVRVPEFDKLRD